MKPIRFNENCYSFWLKVANNRDLELAAGRVISSLESRGRHLLEGKGVGGVVVYYSFLNMTFVHVLNKTNLKQGAHIHQPTAWPVPHACAEPYHPGSGSSGQLFCPH